MRKLVKREPRSGMPQGELEKGWLVSKNAKEGYEDGALPAKAKLPWWKKAGFISLGMVAPIAAGAAVSGKKIFVAWVQTGSGISVLFTVSAALGGVWLWYWVQDKKDLKK